MKNLLKLTQIFLASLICAFGIILLLDISQLIPLSQIFSLKYLVLLLIPIAFSLIFVLIISKIKVNKPEFYNFIYRIFYILLFLQVFNLVLVNTGLYFILFGDFSPNMLMYIQFTLTFLFTIFSFSFFVIKDVLKINKVSKSTTLIRPIFRTFSHYFEKFIKIMISHKKIIYPSIFLLTLFLGAVLYLRGIGGYPLQMDEFFHGGVVKTFSEDGSLFFIDDRYYGRSKITSLIGILSYLFFNKLGFIVSLETVVRLPIALIAVTNIFLSFKLIKHLSKSKILALSAGLLVATETYIAYFATYFRFYTISIFIVLFFMYLMSIKPRSLLIPAIGTIISIICYFLLSEMFLLIMLFFAFVFFITLLNSNINSKLKNFMILALLICSVLPVGYAFYTRLNSGSNYNMVNWNFSFANILYYIKWLVLNYGLYISLFVSYLPISIISFLKNKRLTIQHILELYVVMILLFFFLYMLNVPFNFTFRPNLFILPLLLSLFVIYLNKLLNQKVYIAVITIMILSNLFSSIYFGLDEPGDTYHPTKLVYEKMDILTGSKDIASFLNDYLLDKDKAEYQIGYLGLGTSHVRQYLNEDVSTLLNEGFTNTSEGGPVIEDLKDYIFSTEKSSLIIVSASSIPRHNLLYEQVLNRKVISESPGRLSNFIIEHPEIFKKLYISKDGASEVYLYKN